MRTPKSENPFFLVLFTVLGLGLLSLVEPEGTVAGLELKQINLLSDLSPSRNSPVQAVPGAALATNHDHSPSSTASADVPVQARPKPEALIENPGSLSAFFEALRSSQQEGKKTRIAYFGDSMIEGDLITSDLRNKLQQEFGGEGVGFVPITSVTADFRHTIYHTFSPDWKEYTFMSKTIPANSPLGISGHVFQPNVLLNEVPDSLEPPQPSWVQYTASKMNKRLSQFHQVALFYGPGSAGDQLVLQADQRHETKPLEGQRRVNELLLQEGGRSRKIRLEFDTFSRRNVYGLSFEGDTGVVLDNLSFRGNSGLSLTRLKNDVLQDFNQYQDYKLIILHYGVNVANHKLHDYRFYEKGMGRVLAKLQTAFPKASFLVIGMSDKGFNNAGEITTDPSVPLLLQAQQNVASKYNVAFWNLFNAMGGENSMVDWANAKPALANKDYTHINANGARKIASMLYENLMKSYQQYQKEHTSI